VSAIVALAAVLVLTACANGTDARIQRVYALGRRPSEPNRNRIAAMAADPDRDVRASVLVVLEPLDPARAEKLARTALNDPDGVVRAAAIHVVAGEAGSDLDLAHTLGAMSTHDPSWPVRRAALVAIAGVDDPGVREAFAAALSDSVRHVRRTAVAAAEAHPGLLPLDSLADLSAKDPDWENRVAAARALAASHDPAAFPPLVAASSDPNEFVRAEAVRGRRALERAGIAPAPPPANDGKPGSGV
jgi:HEAT repeat protein